ncbi:MAG TPA: AI-2E family transporter [Anaerolineales bacterium]|nr:AI-2E family transporter [Anaerolineales bacterium]
MDESKPTSPHWGAITKLVVALTIIFILGWLLMRFHTIIGPVLMAFILAYLLHPLVSLLHRKAHFSWGLAVNLIYVVFILILLTLITWGGVGLIGQIQNLINAIQNYANQLPAFIQDISHKVYTLGPIRLDFSTFDWQAIGQQILSYVQPALGKLGGLVGTLASGAATTLGWTAFVVIVSYFFLLESGGLRAGILHFDIPGYTEDIHKITARLGRIWNAFLRGQIIIFFSKVIAYTILMTILGVHYAIPVALIAGFAGFLPYIGPAINWTVLGLVTYFQGGNPFGLAPLVYTLVAIGVALLIDQVFDNLVSPRLMAQTLKVHPAFVLIAAIIAANLLGILGIVIAAPLLATLQLLGRFTMRKMLDENPWPASEEALPPLPMARPLQRLRSWLAKRRGGRTGEEKAPAPAGKTRHAGTDKSK